MTPNAKVSDPAGRNATMKDLERLDLPSASSFEADCLCPGRQQLLATVPSSTKPDEPDEEAEFGIAIHRARQFKDASNLTEEQLEVYERGMDNEKKILNQWLQDFDVKSWRECEPELRLWYNNPDTMEPECSAQLDVHYTGISSRDERVLLIVDWKTLYCTSLTPAERNWQSRLQVIVGQEQYDSEITRMVFNKAMFGRQDPVDYMRADVQMARQSLRYHLWETKQPGAQRRAGNWCNHCPGKPYCPEAAALSLLPTSMSPAIIESVPAAFTDVDAQNMVEVMPVNDVVRVWEMSGVVSKILEACKDRLKTLSDDELVQLGIERAKPKKLDPITATKAAHEALQGVVPEYALWEALSYSKPDLAKILRDQFNWTEKKARQWIEQNLDPYITRKQSEASLKRI